MQTILVWVLLVNPMNAAPVYMGHYATRDDCLRVQEALTGLRFGQVQQQPFNSVCVSANVPLNALASMKMVP